MSKSFKLKAYNIDLKVTNDQIGTHLCIIPKPIIIKKYLPFIFFKIEKDEKGKYYLFWNNKTKNFVRDRVRPLPIIGEWDNKRKIKTSFLEIFTNVQASKLSPYVFSKVFGDPDWDPVFEFLKIED